MECAKLLAVAFLALVPVLLASGCASWQGPGGDGNATVPCNGTANLVQPGDAVTVEFTTRHTTGVKIASGEFTFVSMAGQTAQGFDEAVEGMCLGQEKHVSVPPEKAYGLYDPSLLTSIPMEMETNRTFSVPKSEFFPKFGRQPAVGGMYESADIPYPIRVGAISKDTIMLEKVVTAGYRIPVGRDPWPIDVVRVTTDTIFLYRNVTDGEEVKTPYGNRTVSVANGTITIDLNHELAGETILYDINVISLEKA
ncbi:MAG: FKBP-type peptidyl-prolyl cis-trans isomerase [Candidatus Aenigmatarchaeota archaeon]